MSTYIHGIAASENIDSSGERISIAGMDISSLEKDGVLNWEHKADQPGQVVGRILKAKKIFSEEDCENDYQLEFFKKCGVPYLYVMGELMDDFKESAKEVAGMFMYDHARPQERNISNFSIEGAKIDKQGMDILKSIARKVTITVTPCNKAAVAAIVPVDKKPNKNNIDELFKTEIVEIEILNKDDGFGLGAPQSGGVSSGMMMSEGMKKDQPALTVASGPKTLNQTKSGKAILAQHGPSHASYANFSAEEHHEAANAHHTEMSREGLSFKDAQSHRNKWMLHTAAANTMTDRANRLSVSNRQIAAPRPSNPASPKIHTSVQRPYSMVADLHKSELDSGMTDEESHALMNRTEDKYFIARSALEYVTQAIKENLTEGDIDTEVRFNTNSSIYLDNPDLDSLKDALSSVKPRIKIRVRHYMPNSESWENIAYVEIKSKEEDGSSQKLRIRIHAEDIKSFIQGTPIVLTEDLVNINKDITKQILEKRIRMVNHLVSLYGYRKQIEVRYERRAYTGKDVRITIDENLRFLNPEPISHDNVMAIKTTEGWVNIFHLDHQLKNEGYLILEVKYQGDMPKWAKKILENAQAKKVSFSKYASAMACVVEAKASEGFVSSAALFRESPAMAKALDAGSAMAAPSQLVGGAALASESLERKKKSKWLARAEEEYQKWSKREEFERFMSKRMPNLTKGEIRAIGQVMALNKSMNLEKALKDLILADYSTLATLNTKK